MELDEVPEVEGVDHLYEIDPASFVAARDQLVRQLRAGGDRKAAAAVKSLRRPTLVAWAVNQVVRRHQAVVGELEEATSAVRRAQQAALSAGRPGELREVTQRRRLIVTKLAQAVADVTGSTHYESASATIDAASLDPEAARTLRRGRLAKELAPPAGFGMVDLVDAAEAASPSEPRVDLVSLRENLRRLETDVARLVADVERATGAVTEAEDARQRAETALVEARSGVESARGQLDRVRSERDRAQARLEEAGPGEH